MEPEEPDEIANDNKGRNRDYGGASKTRRGISVLQIINGGSSIILVQVQDLIFFQEFFIVATLLPHGGFLSAEVNFF